MRLLFQVYCRNGFHFNRKVVCVLEHTRTQWNKTVQRKFVKGSYK